MERHILPTYFRHNKYASFQRQLNYFGFRKLHKARDNDQSSIYCQPFFIKNDPSRMLLIKRKTHRLKGSTPRNGLTPRNNLTRSPIAIDDFSFYPQTTYDMESIPMFTRTKSISDPMIYLPQNNNSTPTNYNQQFNCFDQFVPNPFLCTQTIDNSYCRPHALSEPIVMFNTMPNAALATPVANPDMQIETNMALEFATMQVWNNDLMSLDMTPIPFDQIADDSKLFTKEDLDLLCQDSLESCFFPSEATTTTSKMSFTTVVAPFLASLYEILSKEDPAIISWCDDGKSFVVHDYDGMERDILPTYFRHNKFASFQRQLNYFGFRKMHKAKESDQSSIYSQPYFIKSDPSRMLQIKRKTQRLKTPTAGNTPSNSNRRPSTGASDFSFYSNEPPAFTRSKSFSDPMLYHTQYVPPLTRSASNPQGYEMRPQNEFESPFLPVNDSVFELNNYRPVLELPQDMYTQPLQYTPGVDTRMALEMSNMKVASWGDVVPVMETHSDNQVNDIQPIPFVGNQEQVAPFLATLYEILTKENPAVISWCHEGKAFVVYDYDHMEKYILPTYFRHNKFASFQRQLNYFGFRKLHKAKENDYSSVYCQPNFIRDEPNRMLLIKRKTHRPKVSTPQNGGDNVIAIPIICRSRSASAPPAAATTTSLPLSR
ncbi:HSF-type DNA-binding protein, partial [Thraustotheca clavata]